MKVTFFGTRGSVPIANPESVRTGGNTTCLEVESICLPDNLALAVDAGTGFIPFSMKALGRGVIDVHVLFTHWHHDHTQGLPLSPIAFMKAIPVTCCGPVEAGCGPRQVMEAIMQPPFFPVTFSQVASHFFFVKIENPSAKVIVSHNVGGIHMITVEEFERGNGMVSFGKKGKYPVSECLVIRMLYSHHPERTISYRFEERPSGKVFVFLTDHENLDAHPLDMRHHLASADLLVMDSQYRRKRYEDFTAGFGHGTPDFCVRTAIMAGVRRLGLTHHDPSSTDQDVDAILAEAQVAYDRALDGRVPGPSFKRDDIFVCRDYGSVELYGVMPR